MLATCDPAQGLLAFRAWGEAAAERFRAAYPAAGEFTLAAPVRGAAGPALAADAVAGLAPEPYGKPPRAPALEGGPGGTAADEGASAPEGVTLWRCANERAQAQAVAREIEHLLATGEEQPEDVCVVTGPAGREGRLIAAALEERNVPFRSSGSAAFFHRPEVRDVIAWLRALADPGDSSAVVRALTRPPVELRSVDLARCTTIARRRKLDMISAVEAALESPQLPPPSRDRIRAFLKLYRAAAKALDRLSADVFVRRLIERVGFRRHGLFAASPETAERLVNLGRLAELAGSWTRRRPDGSTREFIRYLSAVAEAGTAVQPGDRLAAPRRRAARPSPASSRGCSSHASTCSASRAAPTAAAPSAAAGSTTACWRRRSRRAPTRSRTRSGPGAPTSRCSRARKSIVLCFPEQNRNGAGRPSPVYEAVRGLGVEEVRHEEELFGPAEGLHATYRMMRDEVLEASWRAGARAQRDAPRHRRGRQPRGRPLPRAAQAGGADPAPRRRAEREAIAALNELLGQVATPEQHGRARGLGARLLPRRGVARPRPAGASTWRPRRSRGWRPSCRGADGGLGALGLGPRPLPDLPAQVQVRARLRDPAGADDQPALRDPHPQRARALPRRGDARLRRRRGRRDRRPRPAARPVRGGLAARRASAPPTTSSSTATAPSRPWPATTSDTRRAAARPGLARATASTSRSARTTSAAASTASTATPTATTS